MEDYLSLKLSANSNISSLQGEMNMAKVRQDFNSGLSQSSSPFDEGSTRSGLDKPKKNYTKIPNEIRNALIQAVEFGNERIKQAAQRLGVNYSSAKTIIQIYRAEGRTNKKFKTKKADRLAAAAAAAASKSGSSSDKLVFEDQVKKHVKKTTMAGEPRMLSSVLSYPENSKHELIAFKEILPSEGSESPQSTEVTSSYYYPNEAISAIDTYELNYEGSCDNGNMSSNPIGVPFNTPESPMNIVNYPIEEDYISYEQTGYTSSYNNIQEAKPEVNVVANSNPQVSIAQSYPVVQEQAKPQQINCQNISQTPSTPSIVNSTQSHTSMRSDSSMGSDKTPRYETKPLAQQFPTSMPVQFINNNFNKIPNQQFVQQNNNNNNNFNQFNNNNMNNNNGFMAPYFINMNQFNGSPAPQQFPMQPQIIFINQDQDKQQPQMNNQMPAFMPSPSQYNYNPQPQQFIMQQNQPQQFVAYQDQNQMNGQSQQFVVQNMPNQYYPQQFCPVQPQIIYVVESDFNPAQGGNMTYQAK